MSDTSRCIRLHQQCIFRIYCYSSNAFYRNVPVSYIPFLISLYKNEIYLRRYTSYFNNFIHFIVLNAQNRGYIVAPVAT
nr:MAG TPA: hypothetical protein [Caudoviricetes sp.]